MATRVLPSLHRKNPWSFGMVISIVIVLIIFFLNIEIVCSITGEEEWYPPPICNWTANYTKDSEFVSNVNATLSNLHVNNIEDTSQSRFSISEYGQSPNQIYALIQCRGDATVSQCYSCSKQAKIALEQDCANYVGSRVWSKFCFLRYNGNYNFTGQLDTNRENETSQHFFYNIDTVASARDVFVKAARQLLSSLASVITSGSSRNRYASNSTVDTFYRPLYGLAQCWGDISLHDCKTCLATTIDKLFLDNGTGSGARGLTGNCIAQYAMNSFFNDPPQPPPPRPQNSSSSNIPIILGVLGGLVILLLMVIICAKTLKYVEDRRSRKRTSITGFSSADYSLRY